jgi:ABC-type glycerol-3-phosphate transport system permease component
MLIYSLSDPSEALKGVYLIPRGITMFNIIKVLELKGIGQALLMSVLRTISGTIVIVMCCSFLAYLFTKQEMPLRSFFYRAIIITMYASGGMIPTYLLMRVYGLNNTFLIYILPSAVSAYYVVLIKTFIESLPPSLEESAIIDGAGYTRVYWNIILPLSKPIIATIAVFAAVMHWNSWFDTHIYVTDSNLNTLQYLLYKFLNESNRIAEILKQSTNVRDAQASAGQVLTPKGVRMTVTLLATVPIFLVYPFAQRFFVQGIMIGAIKG